MLACAIGIFGDPFAVRKNGVNDPTVPMPIAVDLIVKATFNHIAVADNEDTHKSRYWGVNLVVKARS